MTQPADHNFTSTKGILSHPNRGVRPHHTRLLRCGTYSAPELGCLEREITTRTTKSMQAILTRAISGSSLSRSSSLLSSSLLCGTVGVSEQIRGEPPLPSRKLPSIRKRGKRSNLQAEVKAGTDVNAYFSHPQELVQTVKRKRPLVGHSTPRRSREFDSLDRHTPIRSPLREAKCALQTALDPEELGRWERQQRTRNLTQNSFLFANVSHSQRRLRNRLAGNGHGILTPHHTPSFVHAQEMNASANPRPSRRNVRYVSLDGVWAVGGRFAAIPMQLHGVDTGTGDILTSGSNAPMITAQFHERVTENSRTRSHRGRLSLALEIDQARRILPVSPPSSPTLGSPETRNGEFGWINNAWSTIQGLPCECD